VKILASCFGDSYIPPPWAAVAQLDRAPDYESGGSGFESLQLYHLFPFRIFFPFPAGFTSGDAISKLPEATAGSVLRSIMLLG
jgi:hypothetical protein